MIGYSTTKKILFFACFFNTSLLFAQQDSLRLSLNKVFEIALENNREIKLSTAYLSRSEIVTADKKNNRLPNIGFSASAGYLTDVGVLGLGNLPDGFYAMPHFANTYALQASMMVYAGSRTNTEINITKLESSLAALSLQKNTQSIKLIVIGYYLDLYQLYQQKKVYEKSILLSKELLSKINDRYSEGIALKSDRIRNELLLSTFELALSKLLDHLQITNNNMLAALALPENAVIIPDDTLEIPVQLQRFLFQTSEEELKNMAMNGNLEIREAGVKIDIASKQLKVVRSYNYPEVSMFLSSALNRPYTFDIPAKDIYANNNSVGLKVNIPIGNLYLSKKKINIASKDISISRTSKELVEQNLNRDVKNNFIRCRESYNQLQTLYKQQELANENYRRITDNYMEQLALNTEVMDASNQKLDADLRVTQAKIEIIYTYYQLLKTLGEL